MQGCSLPCWNAFDFEVDERDVYFFSLVSVEEKVTFGIARIKAWIIWRCKCSVQRISATICKPAS